MALKLNTKLPESIYKRPADATPGEAGATATMQLSLPPELSQALLAALGARGGAPVDTPTVLEPSEPTEVQQAGVYDLQIYRDGPFLLIDRVVATERASGKPRWQFRVHRGPQSQIENIEAVRL